LCACEAEPSRDVQFARVLAGEDWATGLQVCRRGFMSFKVGDTKICVPYEARLQ
jgi:formylglycine-generating enzyme required for sulfatase activity